MKRFSVSVFTFCVTAALLLACAGSITAQVGPWFASLSGGGAGSTVTPFLKMPVSAAVLGQGAAASMGSMDATDIVSFPANTALFMGTRASITHLEWLMGLRCEFAGGSFPIADEGMISIFSKVFTPGVWEGRDIDEQPAKANALDYSVGAGVARKFLNGRLAAGISIAYLESRLDNVTARGMYVNADLRGSPIDLVDARIRIENLGPQLKYTSLLEPLPFTAAAAVSVKPIARLVDLTDRFDFDAGIGTLKAGDDPLTFGARVGLTIIRRIFVRAGYEYALGRPVSGIEGLSAGVGGSIDHYGFDFGWKNQSSSLGMVWAASAHFQGEDIVPKSAKDFCNAAERQFKNKKYTRCIYYAKKALALDPKMWQASTLIARANAEMRRKNGVEIALVYTGNYQGQFIPRATPDGSRGGLARQVTAIKELRSRFPMCVSLDVGNTVDINSPALKAQIAASFYRQTGYDAVMPGSGEIAFGLPAYIAAVKDSQNTLVCSNCREGNTAVITKQITRRGKYSFAILNIVQPPRIKNGPVVPIQPAIDAMTHLLAAPDVTSATLRVMIVHDSWENVRLIAQALPAVDIVICGEQDQAFEAAMTTGTTTVLSAGSRGEYVGNYVIRFNDAGKIEAAENHLIPLTDKIAPDPHMAEVIRRISVRIGMDKDSINERLLAKGSLGGVFTFLSNRDELPGVFLKVSDRSAEFPLTPPNVACFSAIAARAGGHIACLRTPGSLQPQELWLMNMAGLQQRRVAAFHPRSPVFTPDGQWLYYGATTGHSDSGAGIFRIAAEGITPKAILDWKPASIRDITFSTDQQYMSFTSNRDTSWHVYLTNPMGENPVKISEYKADHFLPSFSPDGNCLAYLSTYTGYRGKGDVWVYDRRNGKRTRITQDGHVAQYCWLGDSRTIVYCSGVNMMDMNQVDVSNGDTRKLINTDSIKNYSETSPRTITHKDIERVLYVRDYTDGKRRVYWTRTDGTEDQPVITDNKDSWLEGN